MSPPINEFVVAGTMDQGVIIMRPTNGRLSKDQALSLAAWLVAIVGDRDEFLRLLSAVEET